MTIEELVEAAIAAERKRCYDIVMAARMHEIDTDLRTLLHLIESGRKVPQSTLRSSAIKPIEDKDHG